MILLIDNYDSFTYNLYHMLAAGGEAVTVVRNDALNVHGVRAMAPDHIVFSPGPGRPENAGRMMEFIREFAGEIPMLGVCLGHQAICAVYGMTITYAKRLMHGKQSVINVDNGTPLFTELPEKITVGRYHSLAADPDTLPESLVITARTDEGEVMAVQHKKHSIFGLQFHPESILTEEGSKIIRNFLEVKA